MTALTLTPQPVSASVLIQITGAPAGAVVITRTDANGTSLVRLREGQEPIAGALTITDYEPALVGLLAYDVIDSIADTTSGATTLDGTAEVLTLARRNVVQNPSFEVNTATWIVSGAVALTRDVADYFPGATVGSGKLTRSGGGAISASIPLADAAPGQVWTLSLASKTSGAGLAAGGYLTFYSAAMGNLGDTFTGIPAGAWVETTYPGVVAPAGTAHVGWQLYTSNGIAGDAFWLDQVRLEPDAPAGGGYFDGNTPDTSQWVYEWDAVEGGAVAYAVTHPFPAVESPWIAGVQEPQLAFAPELVTGYDAAREAASQVLRVIGRGDPVILLAPTRTREGQLTIWCRDYVDSLALADVLAGARILMLRQPDYPGMDMYFLAQTTDQATLVKTSQGWRWQTSCRYIELRNPSLPLLGGAGWTFDDVAADYATFAAVRAAFDDFNDLLVGP